MGTAVALVSGKGGTGKTTLCAGIGGGLVRLSQRVLCIDGDVGLRNLDLALGMSDRAVVPFTEVLEDPDLLIRTPEHPSVSGLHLLTAPTGIQPEAVDVEAFAALITQAKECFDWVLVDAPAGIGPGFRMATRNCDIALVVANCEPASLRDAARTAQLLRREDGPELRLAVNRVKKSSVRLLGMTIDDAMDQIGLPLAGLVPERTRLPAELASGKAMEEYYTNPAMLACSNIARRLAGQRVALMKLK